MASTRKQILESVDKYEGYIASDEEYKYKGGISNTIVIRVPAENFDELLADATKGVSKFDSKNITVKDVTEEFLDIQARLKTKKELENRYLELLKKAKSVPEILEVERQLGQLRADIESIEGSPGKHLALHPLGHRTDIRHTGLEKKKEMNEKGAWPLSYPLRKGCRSLFDFLAFHSF